MEVTVLADLVRNEVTLGHLRGVPRRALSGLLVALALLLGACAEVPTSAIGCTNEHNHCMVSPRPEVVVQHDEWQDASNPRRMLARIQSNLDRVSAGQPTWPAPAGEASDPLLEIVGAYVDFLRGDVKGMDAILTKVEAAANQQWIANVKVRKRSEPIMFRTAYAQEALAAYATQVYAGRHDQSPLARLYAGLRAVDGVLWAQMDSPIDVEDRETGLLATSSINGTWLRLPCRTIIGRVPQFVSTSAMLKSLKGPVLDCPVDGPLDYAKDEELALHPEDLSQHAKLPRPAHRPARLVRVPKPPPESRAAAIEEMAMHPHQAAPILERYSHVDASGELDYALFLYALVPETSARDATIRQLLGDIVKKVAAKKAWEGEISSLQYDGTDAVTARIVAAASISSVVGGEGAQHVRDPYTIPCAVLAARPALSAALTDGQVQPDMAWARFPLSGCNPTSSSSLKGFPANAVAAFGEAAGKTQGHAVPSQVETQNLYIHGVTADEAMQLNPGFFLGAEREQMLKWPSTIPPQQSFDYPYQVWGYTSLNNYDISMQVRASYRKALAQLTAYYREHMALGTRDSRLAARLALFAAAPGSRCGGAVPETSIRRMLLEHAPRAQIEQQLQQLRNGDIATGEIEECGRFAGVDPVLLVAVGDPAVFPLVLQRQTDVNVSNPIGKTALMEAAQFNQLGVAHLLLAHHAWVNFTTWSDSDPSYDPDLRLGDDARTALMYAAANGSLELIKTLLDAGADAFQADTKGYRAIDYLLGYGPTPPNPHLSKREREQAAQWLF